MRWILIILMLLNCAGLKLKWETHDLPLRQLAQNKETKSSVAGANFFVVGGFSGTSERVETIKMYALFNGEYILIEKELKKVTIRIDNKIKIPYLQIYSRDGKINKYHIMGDSWHLNYRIVCPEKYLPQHLNPIGIGERK